MEFSGLWALIEQDLSRARDTLPGSALADPTIRQYQEFIDHNELELACDMLGYYGEHNMVSQDFWLALRDAAAKMQLADLASDFERHANGM